MYERQQQQNHIKKSIQVLFVFVMTQYFGALGQYSLTLNNIVVQVWSYSYMIAKIMMIALIAIDILAHQSYTVKLKNFYITVLIIVLACISIYESGTKSETIYFAFRLSLTIIIGVYTAKNFSGNQILQMLEIAQVFFLLLTIVFIFLFPQYAFFTDANDQKVLIGIYTTKNPCAFELIFGALLFYIEMRTSAKPLRKAFVLCMIVMQIILAFQCRSIGAILTGLIVVIITEFLILNKKSVRLDYLYITVNLGSFVAVLFLLPFCTPLLKKLGRDVTLTGRTDIWLSILQFLKGGNYLFGYGYESFWNNESITRVLYYFYASNGVKYNYMGAHNTIVELLLYFGIVGITIYFAVVLNLLKKTSKFEGTKGYFILISFLFFTIHGIVERSLSDSAYDTMIFVLLLTMTAQIGRFQEKKEDFHVEKNNI